MKEKSHKGQRHKGCPMCKHYKQVGNSAQRRPPRDLRVLSARPRRTGVALPENTW